MTKILIVDDEIEILNPLEEMLKEEVFKEVKIFLNMKIYRELSANKIIGIKEIKEYTSY